MFVGDFLFLLENYICVFVYVIGSFDVIFYLIGFFYNYFLDLVIFIVVKFFY